MKKIWLLISASVLVVSMLVVGMLAGCEAPGQPDLDEGARESQVAADLTSAPETANPVMEDLENTEERQEDEMRIKVTDGTNQVVFQLNEGSAAKNLYDQLPLQVGVENYGSNEKIFYPPQRWIPPMWWRAAARRGRWPISPPGAMW